MALQYDPIHLLSLYHPQAQALCFELLLFVQLEAWG